ncbi:MAG: hypothetical protein WAN87_00050 [Thermoplasmata archaeon]
MSRRLRWILILPLAGLVVLASVLIYVDFIESSAPPPVQISSFEWHFGSCYATPQSSLGLATGLSTPFEANFLVSFAGAGDCHIASVTVVTPGFSLLGATVPLDVTADTSGWLSVGIESPSMGFSGIVNIDVNATATG